MKPTSTEVDAAVPVNGTPSRALTNALFKGVIGSLGPFVREVSAKPVAMDSAGTKGDYFIDTEEIYFCVSDNNWRMISFLGWE